MVSFEEQEYMVEPIKPKVAHPEKDGEAEADSEEKPVTVVEAKIVKQPKPKRVTKKKAEVEIDV